MNLWVFGTHQIGNPAEHSTTQDSGIAGVVARNQSIGGPRPLPSPGPRGPNPHIDLRSSELLVLAEPREMPKALLDSAKRIAAPSPGALEVQGASIYLALELRK